jgi:hypothetical protein
MQADGYTERVVAVVARNLGRMPTTISMWSIRFGNGTLYTLPQHPQNRPVPYRLEAHEEVAWYAPLDQLRDYQALFVDQTDDAATATAVVDLAIGAKVEGRPHLVIRADARDADCRIVRPRLPHTMARRSVRIR